MLRSGVIHAELAGLLAGLRHTETFVICDSGLPLGALPQVDLGYRYGAADFVDVVTTVLPGIVVQDSWVSREMLTRNERCLKALRDEGLSPRAVEHEDFKAMALAAKFAVRTGEATFYANVICQAGVAFG